jgi:hypothetical protein
MRGNAVKTIGEPVTIAGLRNLVWLFFGRLPMKRRFRGSAIGWLRRDVLDWVTKDSSTVLSPPTRQVECATRNRRRETRPVRRSGRRWAATYRRLQRATRAPVL